MGLETGWSGITQPGIENRFMDSVVSQLQYLDAYRVATDAKKKKERKKKCVCNAPRPVLLRMLNRPRWIMRLDFKYACPIPTDADRLRENVRFYLSLYKVRLCSRLNREPINGALERRFSVNFASTNAIQIE